MTPSVATAQLTAELPKATLVDERKSWLEQVDLVAFIAMPFVAICETR